MVPPEVKDTIVRETSHFIVAYNGSSSTVKKQIIKWTASMEDLFVFFTTKTKFPAPFCLHQTKFKMLLWISPGFTGYTVSMTSIPGLVVSKVSTKQIFAQWSTVRRYSIMTCCHLPKLWFLGFWSVLEGN
jgi:hypothetical protein